jgi:hypothetical protein
MRPTDTALEAPMTVTSSACATCFSNATPTTAATTKQATSPGVKASPPSLHGRTPTLSKFESHHPALAPA